MKRGWWRRNVWGLVLLLPLLAGLVGLNGHLIYVRNYAERPSEAVPVDATGKATLDDYAVRVIELAPVENEQELKRLRPCPVLYERGRFWREFPHPPPARRRVSDWRCAAPDRF